MDDHRHFDRRGQIYDQDEIHQRIVHLLLNSFTFEAGECVLDLATGTGLVALQVALKTGPTGQVIGLDTSAGMLAAARRNADRMQVTNVQFEQGDAEAPPFEDGSFDRLFCASALVLMSDVPAALQRWRGLLKAGGTIAFDTPSKPFGFSQRATEAAARHGVVLAYNNIADTKAKCKALLLEAGFEVVSVRRKFASRKPVAINDLLAMYDERIDHPAWQGIRNTDTDTRRLIRADFAARITADAVNDVVTNDIALVFSVGRKS